MSHCDAKKNQQTRDEDCVQNFKTAFSSTKATLPKTLGKQITSSQNTSTVKLYLLTTPYSHGDYARS
jgi:hypothetical protein